MLRPTDLTSNDLIIATKPAVGYETRFYVSPDEAVEVGTLEILGQNSGVWTQSAEAGGYDSARHLLAVLNTGYNGAANIAITWGTAVGTIQPPEYAVMQNKIFSVGEAVELAKPDDSAFTMPAGSPTVVCNADAKGVKFSILAIPTVTFGTSGNFKIAGCKVSISYNKGAPQPAPVPCGRDEGAYIKSGSIPIKTFNLRAKIPVEGDVLTRIDGNRVLGLARIIKEDTIEVARTFFTGLILTSNRENSEAQEPDMLTFTGLVEKVATIVAQQE